MNFRVGHRLYGGVAISLPLVFGGFPQDTFLNDIFYRNLLKASLITFCITFLIVA